MKVLRKFKKVFMTLMAMAILGSADFVRADENIASVIYTVKNSVYHDTEIGMSMARSYLDENITLSDSEHKL